MTTANQALKRHTTRCDGCNRDVVRARLASDGSVRQFVLERLFYLIDQSLTKPDELTAKRVPTGAIYIPHATICEAARKSAS